LEQADTLGLLRQPNLLRELQWRLSLPANGNFTSNGSGNGCLKRKR
jgi:hypothetical protein